MTIETWLYSLLSVLIVSSISLIGIVTFSIKESKLKEALLYMVSFSAGTLFSDAFIHLIPEAVEENGFGLNISIYILSGILVFFVVEKILHWRHSHTHVGGASSPVCLHEPFQRVNSQFHRRTHNRRKLHCEHSTGSSHHVGSGFS